MKLLRSSQIYSKRLSARLFPLTVQTGGMAQVSAVYSPVNLITPFQMSATPPRPAPSRLVVSPPPHLCHLITCWIRGHVSLSVPFTCLLSCSCDCWCKFQSYGPNLDFWPCPRIVLSTGWKGNEFVTQRLSVGQMLTLQMIWATLIHPCPVLN